MPSSPSFPLMVTWSASTVVTAASAAFTCVVTARSGVSGLGTFTWYPLVAVAGMVTVTGPWL